MNFEKEGCIFNAQCKVISTPSEWKIIYNGGGRVIPCLEGKGDRRGKGEQQCGVV
jgi:hypothetical protein